jgi:hypothetical protein
LSQLINPETAGKERNQLCKAIVLALRELMRETEPGPRSLDLVAFIILALTEIDKTVDKSVDAWEKRGYWVKADRFRMEWLWSGRLAGQMSEALQADDWVRIAEYSVQVAQHLMNVKVPQRSRLGTPWVGAYDKMKNAGI